jgi:hypothetical protein
MIESIKWKDIAYGKLNYFTCHRFFMLRGFNCSSLGSQPLNLFDYVDVKKEMGEFIPNDIEALIDNQRQFNGIDWLCKKMFARPMNQLKQYKNYPNNNNNNNQQNQS